MTGPAAAIARRDNPSGAVVAGKGRPAARLCHARGIRGDMTKAGIWVDHGCRAYFPEWSLRRQGENSAGGGKSIVRCSSEMMGGAAYYLRGRNQRRRRCGPDPASTARRRARKDIRGASMDRGNLGGPWIAARNNLWRRPVRAARSIKGGPGRDRRSRSILRFGLTGKGKEEEFSCPLDVRGGVANW